jgi:putative transposase
MGTFTQLFFHFVWATKGREPAITPALEPALHGYIRAKCSELGVTVHAVNGMPDHIHLACSLPTTLSVAAFAERIKGASSRFANTQLDAGPTDAPFRWQPGYGVLTFSKRDLAAVVGYIDGQKAHHTAGDVRAALEDCGASE